MLSDNIKVLRKAKGMSQEELAAKLCVVRQTISKWEKGLSVPDSEILIKIADVFEVSVGELLGATCPMEKDNINELSAQLARINEQLAIKNRRTKTLFKVLIGIAVGALLLTMLWLIFSMSVQINIETF